LGPPDINRGAPQKVRGEPSGGEISPLYLKKAPRRGGCKRTRRKGDSGGKDLKGGETPKRGCKEKDRGGPHQKRRKRGEKGPIKGEGGRDQS